MTYEGICVCFVKLSCNIKIDLSANNESAAWNQAPPMSHVFKGHMQIACPNYTLILFISLQKTHPNLCRCCNSEQIKGKYLASYPIFEEDLRREKAVQDPKKETLRG